MTDEEKAEEYRKANYDLISDSLKELVERCYLDGLAEGRKGKNYFNKFVQKCKENEELKKEISVLLSCSNCKENKGGYVCEKEYNDKCLAQKIEYIKELKEENAGLKAQIEKMKNCENCKYNYKEDGEEYCDSPNGVCKRYSTNFDMDNWELAE